MLSISGYVCISKCVGIHRSSTRHSNENASIVDGKLFGVSCVISFWLYTLLSLYLCMHIYAYNLYVCICVCISMCVYVDRVRDTTTKLLLYERIVFLR